MHFCCAEEILRFWLSKASFVPRGNDKYTSAVKYLLFKLATHSLQNILVAARIGGPGNYFPPVGSRTQRVLASPNVSKTQSVRSFSLELETKAENVTFQVVDVWQIEMLLKLLK